MSSYAPRVEAIKINPDKIREVIGKGGETINKIIAETGAEIDIKDDGTVMIASPDKSINRRCKTVHLEHHRRSRSRQDLRKRTSCQCHGLWGVCTNFAWQRRAWYMLVRWQKSASTNLAM